MIIKNRLTKKIGIFDSGIGGISILPELLTLPNVEFFYVADTAHLPYGQRSQQEIQTLSQKAIKFLVYDLKIDLIIIACHTVSTNALDFLKHEFPLVTFIDVVDLVIDQALWVTNGTIGILATAATTASAIHKKKILEHNQRLHIITQPCPQLASAIERDYAHAAKLKPLAEHYLSSLLNASIDTLILGCTHYALIQKLIKDIIGPSIALVSAEQQIRRQTEIFLEPHQEPHKNFSAASPYATIHWFISGNDTRFFKTTDPLFSNVIKALSDGF